MSVEFPDAELLSFLKTYRKLKVKLCVDCITRSKGLHILNPTFLDRDLPRKIVTNGLEVHFKYTGQPVTCYRCGSTEHIVHNCPQRLRPRNNPSPPVAQAEKPAEVRVDLPAEKEPESNETADNTEDMESENPASYAAMASQSLFGDTQDPSHKRPSSPQNSDIPAKKGTSKPRSTPKPGLKRFMGALRQSGPDRIKVMKAMDSSMFYKCQGLFLQNSHSDMSAMDSRALHSLHINTKDEMEWAALAGKLKPDAYADLFRIWDCFSQEKPDLFR